MQTSTQPCAQAAGRPHAVGNTLRQLVYDPVCEGRWVVAPAGAAAPAPPSSARLALATTASFAASGAVHEVIFW